MNILVQLSGGIDSLGALCVAMEKYPKAIYHLVHVILKTQPIRADWTELRWQAQLSCVINMYEELKSYGDFELITPTIEMPYVPGVSAFDSIYFQYISAIYASNTLFKYEYLINGTSKSDGISSGATWEEFGHTDVTQTDPTGTGRADIAVRAAVGALREYKKSDYVYWRPAINHTKKELYELIPSKLKEFIWYCEEPVLINDMIEPCGSCLKCKELAEHDIKGNAVAYDSTRIT